MHRRKHWRDLKLAMVGFVLLICSLVLLWRHNTVLLAVTALMCALALRLWHTPFDLILLLVIGGLGTVAEALFVRVGIWEYANPTILGMPLWFPFAFGTTGMIGGRLAHALAALMEDVRMPTTCLRSRG